MPLDYTEPHTPVYARDPASKSVLLQGAIEGHVLVKNVNNALPLKKPKLLSVFGYDAAAPPAMDVNGFPWIFGAESELITLPFITDGTPPQIAFNGTLISGGKLTAVPCLCFDVRGVAADAVWL
jgi:beta-glucosidase